MKRDFLLLAFLWVIPACKFLPGGDRNNTSADKILRVKLSPKAGTDYNYKVSNKTQTKFEVDENTIEAINTTDYSVNYRLNRDSIGNYLVGIQYKKIHIYTKQKGEESDLDADNAANSVNPIEKMLGALKMATIVATVKPSGEVILVTGYQQIADQFLSQLDAIDPGAKIVAQKQWQQLVEKNLVKKNMDRLFKISPDSSLRIGDKWKIAYKQEGDINFEVKDFFTLKSVQDGEAEIESNGFLSTDSSDLSIMGYQLRSGLKGSEKGEYQIDIGSGMMKNCELSTNIEGTLVVIGREIPISIDIKIKMVGSGN